MIGQIDINEFNVFKRAALEFSPGVNVFIGANATGKTHLLKLLYSMTKAYKLVNDSQPGIVLDNHQKDLIFAELDSVFRPEGGQLIYLTRQGSSEFAIKTQFDAGMIQLNWSGIGKDVNTQPR